MRGTSIYVEIYDDRVEIVNPGGVPAGITKSNFGKESIRRNLIIADLFHRMAKVERMGSGIDRIRGLMREANLKEPVFSFDNFFRVAFYRNPEYALKRAGEDDTEKIAQKTIQKTVQKTTQKQKAILSYLKAHPQSGRNEMARNIKGITESGIKYNLKVLQEKGLLTRIGPANGGRWEVTSS